MGAIIMDYNCNSFVTKIKNLSLDDSKPLKINSPEDIKAIIETDKKLFADMSQSEIESMVIFLISEDTRWIGR